MRTPSPGLPAWIRTVASPSKASCVSRSASAPSICTFALSQSALTGLSKRRESVAVPVNATSPPVTRPA
jgi:hypothetical protein